MTFLAGLSMRLPSTRFGLTGHGAAVTAERNNELCEEPTRSSAPVTSVVPHAVVRLRK